MPTTVDNDGYLKKVLGREERVLFVVHVHGLFFFVHNLLWILACLLIFGFALMAQLSKMGSEHPKVVLSYLLVLVPLVPIWWSYMEWRNQKFVVTNRRVFQLKGVLSKHVIDAALDQINDVKTDQSLLGRIFNYGDVEVVTASAVLIDQMEHIDRPLEFKRVLLDAKEELVRPRPAPPAPEPPPHA